MSNTIPNTSQTPLCGNAAKQEPKKQAEAAAVDQFAGAMKKDGVKKNDTSISLQGDSAALEKGESALNSSFFKTLSRRGSSEKDQGGGSGDTEKQMAEAAQGQMARGDSILAAFKGSQVVQPAGVEHSSRLDTDMTSKLVDRILVSAADSKGAPEVRITLREDVLPGTEVRIQRGPDGNVSIQFVTNDIRAEQMLGQRQLQDLQAVLAQNLQVEVKVSTVKTDGSMTSDSGSNHEQGQQGSQGNQGQPGDGRSRQHDLFEGLQDEGQA